MSDERTRTRSVKRLAVIAADPATLLRQRQELLAEVLARRHSVLALIPEAAAAATAALAERGFSVATYPMPSPDPQMFADGRTVAAIAAALADWRAHVLLATGAKSSALGALGARKAGVSRRVAMVDVLPAALRADTAAVPSWAWRRLMKSGFHAVDAALFHNDGDRQRLLANGVIPPGLPVLVVPGAGVDLQRHSQQPLPALILDGRPALNFLMIARKDAAAGVVDFCRAARSVREKAPDARFVLAGADGDIEHGLLARYEDVVQVVGDQDDVRPLIGAAHVVVVPSRTAAMPRILLEALATGRPVITTAVAGCRDAVDERVNGVLVPPRDPAALAEAMMSFLKRPDLIAAMARASRSKAERRFGVGPVNAAVLDLLGL